VRAADDDEYEARLDAHLDRHPPRLIAS
jgi:hypothetical protein